MAISQLRVNDWFEWNKVHFVADEIALKMNIHLNSDYIFFLGTKIQLYVSIDTVCIECAKKSNLTVNTFDHNSKGITPTQKIIK